MMIRHASTRSTAFRQLILAGLAWLLTGGPGVSLAAQAVSVSPTALFLDQAERSGRLNLVNEGDVPAEVEIDFAFGYARSDSLGRVSVPLSESAAPGEPTLVPYLRAFPRRLRLAPGQQGMVRVLVTAPPELEGGEYWARVMVSSTGAEASVEERAGGAAVRINLRSVVAVATNYRHGEVETSLMVDTASATALTESVQLLLDLDRGGNAAWLGQVQAEIVDPDGRVFGSTAQDVAVYRALRWGVRVPLDRPLDGGPFAVRYTLSPERPDAGPGDILTAPAVRGSVPIG
jgi:hypothetical protein